MKSHIVVPLIFTFSFGVWAACKTEKKKDSRSPETAPSDDDQFLPESMDLVKADSLGFYNTEALDMEPSSCADLPLRVFGSEEKFTAAVDSDSEIGFTSTSGKATFFSDEECKTPITTLSLPKGSSFASLYVSEPQAGEWTIKVKVNKGMALKEAEQKVKVAKAQKMFIENLGEISFKAESCEVAAVFVRTKEGADTVTAGATKVALNVKSGTGKFYATEECSGEPVTSVDIKRGSNEAYIFIKPAAAGPLTIEASVAPEVGYEKFEATINVDPKG